MVDDDAGGADKRTAAEEKFYDFDDAESDGAGVGRPSAKNNLSGQKRNGKLVVMRSRSNDSVVTSELEGADVTSALTSGGASNLAATSIMALTDLISDWKTANPKDPGSSPFPRCHF